MTIRTSKSILVVIVNYRTADLVTDCLRSLEAEVDSLPGIQVVVVDNASGDGSVDRLVAAIVENLWEGWASILPVERNGGFAAGNNAAIQPALEAAAPPDYVLLLNPDTVVHGGALRTLYDFMEAKPEVGIAGSRLEDPDGTPQRSAFRFPSVLGEIENGLRFGVVTKLLHRWVVAPPVPEVACRTDWVSGACLLVRREVFDAVGLLDADYFMYYEEVDFCKRAAQAGWPCWFVPEARVVHLVGQSTRVETGVVARKRQPTYWFASRRRYFQTYLGKYATWLTDLAWASSFASYRVRRVVQRKPDTDPFGLLGDFVRHNLLRSCRSHRVIRPSAASETAS
ncbi:glycosyltransferase family 2 protein [Singulisphaera sp. Ch08]|uniref:Glycosyltransferase family 2 protein n=1 Tax=Singulisphaera sp. Ch08 TaxID=3120278 RepID=A0AAU7CE59_9BACT